MYTAGTTACGAMFVHPGSPERKGALKEGGKGNRKFLHLTCHYVAVLPQLANRCYLSCAAHPFHWRGVPFYTELTHHYSQIVNM